MNTPVPWTYLPTRQGDAVTHTVAARLPDGQETIVCAAPQEADARLIATAVNLHRPMIEFLRQIQKHPLVLSDATRSAFVRQVLQASGDITD